MELNNLILGILLLLIFGIAAILYYINLYIKLHKFVYLKGIAFNPNYISGVTTEDDEQNLTYKIVVFTINGQFTALFKDKENRDIEFNNFIKIISL